MIRLLVFLGVLLALAFGFSWLADNPGSMTLVAGPKGEQMQVELSTTVLAVLLIAFTALVIIGWSLLRGIANSPGAFGSFFERRRRERGWRALSQGIIAVGAGDPSQASRLAADSRRILGNEPLALLLEAQSAQLAGDRAGAQEAFEKMLEDPETRLLGLRGLYMEATRWGAGEAARHYAEEANQLQPRLAWSGQALIGYQSQARDWDAVLGTIERNGRHKIIDKAEAKRLRAVVLTARAQELELGEPDHARNLALEAHGLAPDLVPAAILAARLLARMGDFKRAARVLETNWKIEPHPDIADAYAHVRPGDSAQDRLARAKDLIRVRAHHPECAFALARAELDVRDFAAARASLKPLLASGPTRRVCMLMAEIEEAEHGSTGRLREWLARAVRAPRDAAWVADGYVSDTWAPVSPVNGKLDAFAWKVPPEELAAPADRPRDGGDDDWSSAGALVAVERQAEQEQAKAAEPAKGAEPVKASEPVKVAKPVEAPKPVEIPKPSVAPAVADAAKPAAEPAKAAEAVKPAEPAKAAETPKPAEAAKPVEAKPVAAASGNGSSPAPAPSVPSGSEKIVVLPKPSTDSRPYPYGKAPDDPGPAEAVEVDDPNKRFRLFS